MNQAPSLEVLKAHQVLNRPTYAGWVDWAVQQMMAGQDSPSLCILAGERAPFDREELEALIERTLHELGLNNWPTIPAALQVFTQEHATRILSGACSISKALGEIAAVALEQDYPPELMDFCAMHWGYRDLDFYPEQFDWQGMQRGNRQRVVQDYCRAWLASPGAKPGES